MVRHQLSRIGSCKAFGKANEVSVIRLRCSDEAEDVSRRRWDCHPPADARCPCRDSTGQPALKCPLIAPKRSL